MPCIIAVFVGWCLLAPNLLASDFQVIRSKPCDDVILEVGLSKVHNKIFDAGSIMYHFRTVTNFQLVLELPKDQYFCSIEMQDATGQIVPLRQKFAYIGTNFFNLQYPSAAQPWNNALAGMLKMKPAHITGLSAGEKRPMIADFVVATSDTSAGVPFYDIRQLYDMVPRRNYKIKIQLQVYARIKMGDHHFVYKLLRLGPVEFFVTKS